MMNHPPHYPGLARATHLEDSPVSEAGYANRLYVDAVHTIARSQGRGRYLCPKCGGGSDKELSLQINCAPLSEAPTGAASWRCWRASCGFRSPRYMGPD